MAFAVPLPTQGLKAACDAVLVRFRPLRPRLIKTQREHFSDGRTRPVLNPTCNEFLPWISFVTVRLLGRGLLDKLGCFQPPEEASIKVGFGFRPELIAIARETVDIDRATRNRPETPTTRFVSKISGMIDCACEYTLAWRFDRAFPVGRPETIRGAAHEGLDTADFEAVERIEFGELDDPYATRL